MITHYLKVAVRNLLKYKTQNLISIGGLAVGLFCFCICFYISRFVGRIRVSKTMNALRTSILPMKAVRDGAVYLESYCPTCNNALGMEWKASPFFPTPRKMNTTSSVKTTKCFLTN